MQTYLYFLLQLYHKKAYHLLANHKLRERQGELVKLSPWKVLVNYLFFLLPLEVKIIELYILPLETNIAMDKKQLEKLENIMVFLMKLDINGTLINMLVLTFGQWYFYPPLNTLQLLYFI